jgi:hypothetical protein
MSTQVCVCETHAVLYIVPYIRYLTRYTHTHRERERDRESEEPSLRNLDVFAQSDNTKEALESD